MCTCLLFYLQDGDKLIRLWIHEIYRVFYDRLIDDVDKVKFFGIAKKRLTDFFGRNVESVKTATLQFFDSDLLFRTFCQTPSSINL